LHQHLKFGIHNQLVVLIFLILVEQRRATKRNHPHPPAPLTARMIAPITEVIETELEMSIKSVGFIIFG
jgi:hypothetical protein